MIEPMLLKGVEAGMEDRFPRAAPPKLGEVNPLSDLSVKISGLEDIFTGSRSRFIVWDTLYRKGISLE